MLSVMSQSGLMHNATVMMPYYLMISFFVDIFVEHLKQQNVVFFVFFKILHAPVIMMIWFLTFLRVVINISC